MRNVTLRLTLPIWVYVFACGSLILGLGLAVLAQAWLDALLNICLLFILYSSKVSKGQ